MIVSRTLQSASNFYLSKNIFLLQTQRNNSPEPREKEGAVRKQSFTTALFAIWLGYLLLSTK